MRRVCQGLTWVASVVLLGLAAAGCSRAPESQPLDVEITRQRWNVDEKAGIVRIVGEIVNHGPAPVREVEIRAVLIGVSGEARGENTTPILRNLAPGEKRQFALNVRSHDGVVRVELLPQRPEKR